MLPDLWTALLTMLQATLHANLVETLLKFFPFVLLLELPLYLLVVTGMLRYGLRDARPYHQRERYPSVSCVITCYSEGEDVVKTIRSLALQEYHGHIEIIPVVDGALQNQATLHAAQRACADLRGTRNRHLMVLPKWQRGGRVSALNAGLSVASGEIIMALDGDTSFDNDMVEIATAHFDDAHVAGVAGCLRVRNFRSSLAARLQGLEYVVSIAGGKTGLSEFNLVNNISGAFGVFRSSLLRHIGGWDAGTAEDLDLTTRIKQYFGRHPELRIVFEPHAVGHTDAPPGWRGFFNQRLRWDGDLFYLFFRKYRHNYGPRLLGWRTFLFTISAGIFLQLFMPFLILIYTVSTFVLLPPGSALGILAYVYMFYLLALSMYMAIYLLAVSERPRQDLGYALFLPAFPLFAFAARLHSAYATLHEIFLHAHLDSAMAPWWVLKKTKF